jgi:hypothetical protein
MPAVTTAALAWVLVVAGPVSPGTNDADSAAPNPQVVFAEGMKLFREAQDFQRAEPTKRDQVRRRFRAAAEAFERLYDRGVISTELLTNVANAYYFAGDLGKAVLFYRRALLADSGNRRARDALEAIRSQLPLLPPPPGPAANLAETMLFWHHGTSFQTRRWAFLLVFPCVWVCLGLGLWRPRPFRRLGVLLALIAAPLATSLVYDAAASGANDDGVIMAETVGRRGDHASYSPSHNEPFPPGTEVTVTETRARQDEIWLAIRLLDGSESWVPAARAERLLPPS